MKVTEEFWQSITEIVADSHRLSVSELAALRNNRTAKLIVAIPALADCNNADRIAVQHLSTYLTAQSADRIFGHRPEDDRTLFVRLERISNFDGGDSAAIKRGMNLLALTMVANYEKGVNEDRRQGVYNPVDSGEWNAEELKTKLIKEIRSVDSPEMDEIMDAEYAIMGSWNG